jgi:microcystin-dependent protein
MKKIGSTLIALLIGISLFSQTGFSYQGVLRNETGKLRTNETLDLTASLIQDGKTIYTETHQVITNNYGVFSIIIGQGTSQQSFSGTLFLNEESTSINPTELEVKEGGKLISKTQILGVPFAEVAKVALKAQIDFPAGSIIAFGGDAQKIPSGWLFCDGKGYDKTVYPDLFNAIGTNWGADNNLFRVPDLRGVFLRGVNYDNSDKYSDPDRNDRSNRYNSGNVGNTVGSYQADTLGAHKHDFQLGSDKRGISTGGLTCLSAAGTNANLQTLPTKGDETRPVNAYVNYIIKF